MVLQSDTATCSSHTMKEPFDRQPKDYWSMLPRLECPASYPEGLFWWFGLFDIYEISTVPSIHPVQKPRLAAIVLPRSPLYSSCRTLQNPSAKSLSNDKPP